MSRARAVSWREGLASVCVVALLAGCVSKTPVGEKRTAPVDPGLCGNGVVDPGELCDVKPAPLKCPEPWGICWQCSSTCQSRTIFSANGLHQLFCEMRSGTIAEEHSYDAAGNLLTERTFGNGTLLGRAEYTRDERGRELHRVRSDEKGRVGEEVITVWGDHGDVETVKLNGRDAWHPRAAHRSVAPPLEKYNPYPSTAEYSKRVHDTQGRLIRFVWEPRPGPDHADTLVYGRDGCDVATERFGDDRNHDGRPDYRSRYVVSDDCRALSGTADSDGDGVDDRREEFAYDSANRPIRTSSWGVDAGVAQGQFERQWNDAGLEIGTRYLKNGQLQSETRTQYESHGHKTLSWSDSNGDGKADSEYVNTYDSLGRLLTSIADSNGDGQPESVVTRVWRNDGIEKTTAYREGLRCVEQLDLEGREREQRCTAPDGQVDTRRWVRDAETGLTLSEHVTVGNDTGDTTFNLECLRPVFSRMPWVLRSKP